MMRALLALLSTAALAAAAHVIDDFGARPGDASVAGAQASTAAIAAALLAANASAADGDREALVPAGSQYYVFAVELSRLANVTLRIDGELHVSDALEAWPNATSNATTFDTLGVINVADSTDVRVTGAGEVDGHGRDWWWRTILHGVDGRPKLLVFTRVSGVTVDGSLLLRNSPSWHIRAYDCERGHIADVTILVDVDVQRSLLSQRGDTFPNPWALNTDGIDVAGRDFVIERVNVTNWDDAIVAKPGRGDYVYAPCSENVVVRDSVVYWGVGLSVGSVPPRDGGNCVRNWTFQDVDMHHPMKAVYVKTNPGDSGWGLIDGVTYRRINVHNALWYGLWLGPQQQHQPGKNGTGCSWGFPAEGECATNPRVNVSGIVLEDVSMTGSLLWPGVVHCDPDTPCTGLEFRNVTASGDFLLDKEWYCDNVEASASEGVEPAAGMCF